MTSILSKLFEHNHWANLRAVAACANLTDAHLDATVHGTADSIRKTLMHIAGAEQRYLARLFGREPTYNERDGWPGADALGQALDESGRALIEASAQADQDKPMTVQHGGQTHEMPTSTLYVQAINHATEHRSQIATILTQQGIDPPDFSAWAWAT
jgi:uncharacterized damage-inducible protein DinB